MMIRISDQCGVQCDSDNESDIQAFSRNQSLLQRHSRCNSDLQPHPRSTSFCLSTCLVSTEDSTWSQCVDAHGLWNSMSRGTNPRPLNARAKLMGLESMPSSSSAAVKTGGVADINRFLSMSTSARNSLKDPNSPRWKNTNMIMNPTSSSRILIEPAPWRHKDGTRDAQKQPLKHVKVPPKILSSSTSIYSEIDKRLKDLEFKQSGKDLRTLKQMEATQAKTSLKTHKEEQTANLGSQKQPLKHVKVPSKIPSPSTSIYSEIDRRSKDRGFKQPGEDLRLLQQILEATQAKRPLKTHKEEQTANLGSQKQPLKHVKVPSKISSPSTSIYSEIDRRSKDRGLKQPGEDLRLLQQIVEPLQTKGLLKTDKLVQELIRLSSTHDEASTDYITSLRENTNPDHRYISEILLASGLLLRDLGSGTKTLFQLHPSGHPINPELLFVLEQTRARFFLSEEVRNYRNVLLLKLDRVRRKLVFDSVNEILVGKLALLGASAEPWINSGKLATKTLNAQKLLKELCTDIEQFQAKKSNSNTEDGLKNILWEDFTCQFKSWTDFNGEIYGMILNVEQMVFKDLVNEIVIEEGGILLSNQQRRRRLQKNSPVTSSTVLI